ncbi:MAG: DnaJ domain-containing protein [Pelosinus sp.]|nr:DnaJ domain-containing protein [Pelosinus sp.]
MKSYYDILAISQAASQDEIKKSYRKLSKQCHPDLHPGDKKAELRFREISEAYTVLSNPEARKKYDQQLDVSAQRAQEKTSNNKKTQPEFSTSGINFDNVNRQFESFFGFNPKSNKISADFGGRKNKQAKNILDTSEIFESFFKPKNK